MTDGASAETAPPGTASSPSRRAPAWRAAARAARGRADLVCLVGVGLLALAVRLAFSFRSPPFITNDSLSYLLPAFDLVHGDGFAPILKRPPLYSAFIAGVLGLFGEELRVLMLIQHLLGVVTVLLAFGIGRLVFGRAGGLLGALLTALSGPLIVTEQYLMSETLFTVLLAGGLLAYLLGVRGGRLGWLALAGLLLGLAALTRPIAQLVLVLLVAALPVWLPRWRPALAGAAVLGGLFALTVLPWMARNQAVQGTFAIAGGTGEGLAVRTIRYDQRFDFREPPGGDADPLLARARRIYREEAKEESAFELARRLREELKISEVEAERLMRTIALQAIQRQPGYYLHGTTVMLVQTFVGRPVRLRQDWLPWRNIVWEERVEHLLPAPTPAEDRGFAAAERLATLFDPARVAGPLALLMVVGILAGLAPGRRVALLLGGLVLALLLAGVALIGVEYRYRYPLDPLINVLAAGGLVTAATLGRALWQRATARSGGPLRAAPAGASAAGSAPGEPG